MQKTFDQIGMQGIADPSKIPGMEFINLADMHLMPPQNLRSQSKENEKGRKNSVVPELDITETSCSTYY